VVVGGGAVGVELMGELAQTYPDVMITLVHSREHLLPGKLMTSFKEEVLRQLRANQNVEVILQDRLELDESLKPSGNLVYCRPSKAVTTEKGRTIEADLVIFCGGARPNTVSMQAKFSEVLDHGGHVKVNQFLQVEGSERIFALGDCSNVDETKRGTSAKRQANHIAKNIALHRAGFPLQSYTPKEAGLSLTLGTRGGAIQPPLGLDIYVGQYVAAVAKSYNLGCYRGWRFAGTPRPDTFKEELFSEVNDEKLERWAQILSVTAEELKGVLRSPEPDQADLEAGKT